MWAIALLASSWTLWCFTSKAYNPEYRNDPLHPEASKNIVTSLPYIKNLILDGMLKGDKFGKRLTNDPATTYRPVSGIYHIRLRKRDKQNRDTR
jgi:hypothetical protein